MSWPKVAIRELVKISKGKKHNLAEDEAKHRYIQIDDLRNDNLLKYTDDEKGTFVEPKDVIIAWDGANAGTIGYGLKGLIGSTLARLSLTSDKVNTEYLGRFLQSKFREIRDNCTGATIPHVSKVFLVSLQIPLPPLPVQKQIAAVLEKADTLRGQCQQMEQELNTLAQSVFLDMFGDPITNPKGLEMTTLGEWAETLSGFAFKSKEYSEKTTDIKLCRGINIMPGEIRWKDAAFWCKSKTEGLDKYWMKKADLVIAMDRPWISSGFKIAQISDSDLPSLLLQRVMRIRGIDEIENNYFYHCLNHPAFLKHSHITETTVPHISPKDIKSYRIFNLDRSDLVHFNERVSLLNSLLLDNKMQQKELIDNFNSLMQRAFKGELEFKNIA